MAALLVLGLSHRAEAAGFRVVVRITSETSRALAERVRGQTSDLLLELVTLDTGPLESPLPSQLATATSIARQYDADAVVWLDDLLTPAQGGDHLIVVHQPKVQRLLIRELGAQPATPKRAGSESAELEAAALIVRGALQAMMQGGVIGVEQATLVSPEPEKPLPPESPPAHPASDLGDTTTALPGIFRVPFGGSFERQGFAVAAAAGYGWTESVLGEGDSHQRVSGRLAASFRANEWLAFAALVDGRYDWHRHLREGDSSGWIGEPHLGVRVGSSEHGELHFGAALDVGFPGDHAPSIEPSAISPALSLLATYAPAGGSLALASLLGFRLDRGKEAVNDPDHLSRAQRLSIGVSDTNAVLLGLGLAARVAPRWEALGEWTWDVRAPSKGASLASSPMRIAAGARYAPLESGRTLVQLMAEFSPSERPPLAPGDPLVVVEPRVGFSLGVLLRPPRAIAIEESAGPTASPAPPHR